MSTVDDQPIYRIGGTHYKKGFNRYALYQDKNGGWRESAVMLNDTLDSRTPINTTNFRAIVEANTSLRLDNVEDREVLIAALHAAQ